MRKIIIGMDGCPKCRRLSDLNPDAEYIEADPNAILPLARELKLVELPFMVVTGSVEDLAKI